MSRILQYLEKQRDMVIKLQEKLVAAHALGPDNQGRGEKEKADFLLSFLRGSGFEEIIEVNSPDSRASGGYRPNIIARIKGKNPDKTLWVVSHLDVVPPGDIDLWDSDPFSMKVVDDLIYGRGVEDNHQGLVSSILCGLAFLELGIKPEISLGLVMVADEETGNRHGLPYVLDQRKDLFSSDDLYLVPDFGTPDSKLVDVVEKSLLWIKVSVAGRQCHASRPDIGINTLVASAAFILKIEKLKKHFPKTDKLFSPPGSTFSPTKKEANVPNVNTIPGKDIFYIDCRVLPDYQLDEVVKQVRAMGLEIESEYGVKVSLEAVMKEQSAPRTDPSSEIVTKLSRAISKVWGVKPVLQGIGGLTVAMYLRHRGYKAVVWATLNNTAHQANECSSITSTINDAGVMAYLACPW